MKCFLPLVLVFFLISVQTIAQNIGLNTTGAAPASTNMLEVLDIKTANNSTGIYSLQSGAIAGGTGYALQAIKSGASLNNIAAYLSASGGTNNYALLVPSGGGFVGFGTSTPGAELDVKSTLRLSGSTSGYVGLTVPAAAGSTTYTLPSADGSSGQSLVTNGSGTLSWSASGGGSVYNQIISSGGKTFEMPVFFKNANSHSMIGQNSGGVGGSYTGSSTAVMLGRTTNTTGYLPTGTVIKICASMRITQMSVNYAGNTNVFVLTSSSSTLFRAYGNTSATNPGQIAFISLRESDGGTDTDVLFSYTSGGIEFFEIIITVQANSTNASYRVADIEIKRNGTSILTKTGRRVDSASLVPAFLTTDGAGTGHNTSLNGPMWMRIELP